MANTPLLKEIFLYQLSMMGDIIPSFLFLWQIIWTWGWIFIPFILWPVVSSQWLFYRNVMWAVNKNPQILLEVKIPEEMEKPIRAMDVVFSGIWQLYGPPNWFEKWWEGQFDYSFSLEITSIEGVPHFLLRVPMKQRTLFEQHIYSQYPDAEIFEVEDYTQKVPQNIPNDRWEMWGTDYSMMRSDCYSLKTYRDFETENEKTEEKRIDPISSLLEGLSMLEEGEQLWIQIKAKPVTEIETGFETRAKKEYGKLVGRKEKAPPMPLFFQVTNMIFGFPKENKEDAKEELYPAEMKLTPIERATVESIERKRTKHIFQCFVRYIYLAKKEKLNMSRIKIPMSYFNSFNNRSLGEWIPYGKTITKIKRNWHDFFWRLEKRLYVRKRRMFKNYVRRERSSFPIDNDPKDVCILSSEELATLYHFPSKTSSPPSAIPRVDAKKKEAPYNLPTDD